MPPIVHEVLRSSGRPIDAATRTFMEPRFGHDFSEVRVHTDTKAAESASAVNALAYTVRQDVVFGEGQYAPHTTEGRRLLAHELTHVVQQRRLSDTSSTLEVSTDRASEDEANAVSTAVARPTRGRFLIVAHRFATPCAARVPRAQEFPGFSQSEYLACGAASLVSAILIWDRERKDPNSPNTLLEAACSTILVYMGDHPELARGWDAISFEKRTGRGQELYDATLADVSRVRNAARAPKGIEQGQYQVLGDALYFLFKNTSHAGLNRSQMTRIQNELGIGATRSEAGNSFDELMNKLTGLKEGQIAQVSWYSRGKTQASGTFRLTPHVFLVGRFQRGPWFVSDQGPKRAPTELEAPDLIALNAAIRENTKERDEGIYTGEQPTQTMFGRQIPAISDAGVMVLGDRGGLEPKSRDVIMKKDDFIAEVDASAWRVGDRIVVQSFVARADSLADARKEMDRAGTSAGGVIVEHPIGLFHVFTTSLVRDTNVKETKIDESDSKNGKLSKSPKRYHQAWLQLCSAKERGAFFQVY